MNDKGSTFHNQNKIELKHGQNEWYKNMDNIISILSFSLIIKHLILDVNVYADMLMKSEKIQLGTIYQKKL